MGSVSKWLQTDAKKDSFIATLTPHLAILRTQADVSQEEIANLIWGISADIQADVDADFVPHSSHVMKTKTLSLECVSKRKRRQAEPIFRQFKAVFRRFSGAKSRETNAEIAEKRPEWSLRVFLKHTLIRSGKKNEEKSRNIGRPSIRTKPALRLLRNRRTLQLCHVFHAWRNEKLEFGADYCRGLQKWAYLGGAVFMFESWQLAMMDDAGYNGVRDEHIDRLTESLLSTGLTEIDRSTFEHHCHKCGIDPSNFTQADLDRLQEKLNE